MPKFYVSQNYGDGESSDEVEIESSSMRSAAREIYQRDFDIENAKPIAVTLNVRPEKQVEARSQCRVERLPDGSIGISQMINREPAKFLYAYEVSIWDEHNPVAILATDEREAARTFINEHKPPFHLGGPLMLSVKGPQGFCRKVIAWLTENGLQAEVISKEPNLQRLEDDLRLRASKELQRKMPKVPEKFETRIDAEAGTISHGTPSLRIFFVSVWREPNDPPVNTALIEAPSVREAAGLYILQTQEPIPMALGGTVDLRVQEKGSPDFDFDRVTCWTDKDGIHARVQREETDSASEAIDNMMTPLDPYANEVSEAGTMTNSRKKPEVYVDPDLHVENTIVPFPPPHPWTVFRIYSGDSELQPTLVLAMSFEEALKKAEDRGLLVRSIGRVDFEDTGVEMLSDF